MSVAISTTTSGRELFVRVSQRVREHQPALSVSVEHLDRAAAVVPDHVAGALCRSGRCVVGDRHETGDPHPDFEVAQRGHRRDDDGSPGHVGLHRHHGLTWLQRQTTSVVRDALTDEDDM